MSAKQVMGLYLSIRDAVDNFLLDQEISNCAKGTIDSQRRVLGFMADFAEEMNWPPLEDIGKDEMRQYLVALKSRARWFDKRNVPTAPISDSYYETQYRRIKRFFNWCVAEGYTEENPLSDIPHPKVPQRVVPTVPDEDIRRLLMVSDPKLVNGPARIFRAIRDQAALWLLIDTPGRREEIARITVDHVDLQERRVLVEGKGRRERYMYLGAVSTRAMSRYKIQRDALDPVTNDWWVDCHGNPIAENWLYRMLRRLSVRAGIPAVHPHQFRHTFSINMIENNVPLPTLEVMGGWTKIPDTYLATLGDRAAKAAHRRVSPADRIAAKK